MATNSVEVEYVNTFKSNIKTDRSHVAGTVFKDEVILADKNSNIYATSLKLQNTYQVCKGSYDVYSCSRLKDGRIVCGSTHGSVLIFSQHWNFLREFNLRRFSNTSTVSQYVLVDVDEDDMVLAAIFDDTVLQIFNPDDSRNEMKLLAFDGAPIRDVRALSSGDVIARICKANDSDLSIVNRSGKVTTSWPSFFSDKDVSWSLGVDRSCDVIYVIYWDDQRDLYSVSLHSLVDGVCGVVADKVIDFKGSGKRCNGPTCAVTEPGKLVIYYNGEFQTYRIKIPPSVSLIELTGESHSVV